MMVNPDDVLIDAHMHVVPPGLPGLHAFPAVLDEAVATVAAAVRADMAAYRAFLAPLLDDPTWWGLRADNARALFRL
jgi:hypothetical protein